MQDAEFCLLVAACDSSLNDSAIAAPPTDISWDRLLYLASRHRVQALCWHSIRPLADRMPDKVAASFHAQAREIVVANLGAATECLRLQQSFKAADITLRFLKGLTLAALAYHSPFLKMSADIDLLIEPDRLAEAAHELRSAGYRLMIPAHADAHSLLRWHRTRKESVWYCHEGGFQIDLHTRLADHPTMLPGLTASSAPHLVTVATGIVLPTLAEEDLFAYLCVHGASSAWFRLKWLTDLAGLLLRSNAADIERLYQHAESLGADRAAGQALLLADRLYSLDLGERLRTRLASDRMIRWLLRLAERELFAATEPIERFLGTAAIHISQLGLKSGWRFKVAESTRQLSDIMGAGMP